MGKPEAQVDIHRAHGRYRYNYPPAECLLARPCSGPTDVKFATVVTSMVSLECSSVICLEAASSLASLPNSKWEDHPHSQCARHVAKLSSFLISIMGVSLTWIKCRRSSAEVFCLTRHAQMERCLPGSRCCSRRSLSRNAGDR